MQPGSSVVQDPARGTGDAAGRAPNTLIVFCTNSGCHNAGVRREVRLVEVAPEVLAVPGTLQCGRCGYQMYKEAMRHG